MKNIKNNQYYQLGLMIITVVIICILFYFSVAKIGLIINFVSLIIKIFTPFIIGFVFAYLLNPIVKYIDKKLLTKALKKWEINAESKKKITYGLSISLSCLITLGIIILLFSFVIPEVLKSIEVIIINTPSYLEEVKNFLLAKLQNYENLDNLIIKNYTAINNYFNNIVSVNILPRINELITTFSSGFIIALKVTFNIIMGFIISIYFLAGKSRFKAQIKKLLYSIFSVKIVNDILDNARHTDKLFGNFIVGKLLDGMTIGFITFLFLAIFGYPYPLLIGVIIGLTNMIPYFGPYIGTIPSAMLIIMDSPTKCLIFIIFIVALQQVDSYVIDPHLSGAKTGLRSFWVLFSILIFGGLFGILGLLLGVPIFALIYGYVNNLCNNKLKKKKLPIDTKNYEKLVRVNSKDLHFVKEKS